MGVLEDRLAALAERGSPACVALWVEHQRAEPALAALAGRSDALSRLQQARLLFARKQPDDATQVLDTLGDLPPGLESLRRWLAACVSPAGAGDVSTQVGGFEGNGAVVGNLSEWLTRIRSWREVLGV